MKIFYKVSVVVLAIAFMLGLTVPIAALGATTPSLGTAGAFGILSSTFTRNSGVTAITGNAGYTTLSGGGTDTVSGTTYVPAPAQTGTDQATALSALALASQPCTFTFTGALHLASDTTHGPIGIYTPGVYCSTGDMDIDGGGTITLNGNGTYIFRSDGAFNSTANSIVALTGDASACDVFWTPTAATTLGANSTFIGTDIDNAGITVGSTTSWTGRALDFATTVTTDTDTIAVPSCNLPAPATLRVIKSVINVNGGTATSSDFTIHVKNLSSGLDVSGSPQPGTTTPGTLYLLSADKYVISENANSSYIQTFLIGDCDSSGNVTLSAGDNQTCTIINTDIPAPVSGGGGGSVIIVPLIGILKVPSPLALPAGSGSVTYNYTVWNVGGLQALTDVSVADDKCSPVTFLSGDTNGNGKLDPGEKWKYSCTTTLATTTTNTAIATGYSNDGYHQPAIATAIATVAVAATLPPPLINIVKVPNRLIPLPFGGGNVTYTYTVTNPGVVAMNNVTVTDDKCAPVSRTSGDANGNNLLDPGETWIYTCQTNVPVSTRNVAMAQGMANGFTTSGYAFATVLVSAPAAAPTPTPGLPNAGLPPERKNIPWNIVILAGVLILVSISFVVVLKKHRI